MKKGNNWKSVSLITAIVIAITTVNAQPDSVRIASFAEGRCGICVKAGQ